MLEEVRGPLDASATASKREQLHQMQRKNLKELREMCKGKGLDCSSCSDKRDVIDLLASAETGKGRAQSDAWNTLIEKLNALIATGDWRGVTEKETETESERARASSWLPRKGQNQLWCVTRTSSTILRLLRSSRIMCLAAEIHHVCVGGGISREPAASLLLIPVVRMRPSILSFKSQMKLCKFHCGLRGAVGNGTE